MCTCERDGYMRTLWENVLMYKWAREDRKSTCACWGRALRGDKVDVATCDYMGFCFLGNPGPNGWYGGLAFRKGKRKKKKGKGKDSCPAPSQKGCSLGDPFLWEKEDPIEVNPREGQPRICSPPKHCSFPGALAQHCPLEIKRGWAAYAILK